MIHNKKREEFLKKFKEKYPSYEILSFDKVAGPIIFKDAEGVLHKKNNAFRVLTHNIRFDSVIDKESYIQNKLNVLGTGLTLVQFKGMKKKVIVKDINGFTYSPQAYDLLQGHSVTIESCNEKEELFKFKAALKHNNKYIYGSFKYINSKQKIPIICPVHGEFKLSAECHLFGNGCRKCKNDSASFSRSEWIERFKNKLCTFYILEFYNNNELFIKVGITAVNIKKRYANCKNYKYKLLLEIKGSSEYISDLEKSFLFNYKEFKYNPLCKFEGRTECFLINIKNKIYEQFKC